MIFWRMIEAVVDGNTEMLTNVFKVSGNMRNLDNETSRKWKQVESFFSKALGIYLSENQIDYPMVQGEDYFAKTIAEKEGMYSNNNQMNDSKEVKEDQNDESGSV
jgi:hypothetical protein